MLYKENATELCIQQKPYIFKIHIKMERERERERERDCTERDI